MSDMHYRPLGDSGLMVSAVGLGCNAFGTRIDADQTRAVVDAAIDAGITLFDTADAYGDGASEELLGRALGSRRESVLVATKFGMGDHDAEHFGAHGSRRYVRRAVEASLRRLGTDHIDLYQLHRPDPITPVEETLQAMSELVTEGKVRYIGSSNLSALAGRRRRLGRPDDRDRSASSRPRTSTPSTTGRPRPSSSRPARRWASGCCRTSRSPTGCSPASTAAARRRRRGRGSRARRRGSRGRDWDRIEALESFARERDLSMLQVAVGGLAAQPAVASVISGATRPEQVRANAEAGLWEPSLDDLAALDALADTPAFSYTTFA